MADETTREEALFTIADYALNLFSEHLSAPQGDIPKTVSKGELIRRAASEAIDYFPRKTLIYAFDSNHPIGADEVERVLRNWLRVPKRGGPGTSSHPSWLS